MQLEEYRLVKSFDSESRSEKEPFKNRISG